MDDEYSSWMVPTCVLIWEEGHKSLLGFPSCKGILFMRVTPRIQSPPKALSLAARALSVPLLKQPGTLDRIQKRISGQVSRTHSWSLLRNFFFFLVFLK